jgi:transposase
LPHWDPTAMARSQELAHLFQQPDSPAHRHYEICRAYFYESAPAHEIAKRFHLHSDSVRAMVRDFARARDVSSLFAVTRPGPKTSPKRDAISERACALRRQGATLADIRAALQREGFDVSESYLFRLLSRAGLARRANVVPRRSRASTPTTVPSCRTSPTSGSWSSRTDGNSRPTWPASSCSILCCWTWTCPRPSALPSCPAPSRSRHYKP